MKYAPYQEPHGKTRKEYGVCRVRRVAPRGGESTDNITIRRLPERYASPEAATLVAAILNTTD